MGAPSHVGAGSKPILYRGLIKKLCEAHNSGKMAQGVSNESD